MPPDEGSSQRIEALERKVARLEQDLTAAKLSLQRASVQQALMDERLMILERNRLFHLWGKIYRGAARWYGRTGFSKRYGGLSDLRTPGDYAQSINRQQQEMAAGDHRGCAAQWRSQPLLSVWLTGSTGALSSLQSVVGQCYPNWELCVPEALQGESDSRIRIVQGTDPSAAAGEFVLMLQAGDRLSPHALYFYAQALQDDSLDMVYADEDHIDRDGNRTAPLFKPGWSPELMGSSTVYPGRAMLSRRGTTLSRTSRVHHIPRVLYHLLSDRGLSDRGLPDAASTVTLERTPPQYTAPPDARLSVIVCSRQVERVRECLGAVRNTATVPTELLVVHHLSSGSGDEMRQCVEQYGGMWIPYRGPFDFSRMNNLAAAQATAPDLLFLNDDVIVQKSGWDQAFAATLARPEIGIAGAILEYPNGAIQHAGVVVGMGDGAGHCGRFQMTSDLWPWLRMSRDVAAVTGAMLGIRSDVFRQMRGFDEIFPVNYNDVDLCLRVRACGLRVVCLDVGKVTHRESQTRVGGTRYGEREALYKRWPEVLAVPDEFYSPHLAPTERIALNLEGPGKSPLSGLV